MKGVRLLAILMLIAGAGFEGRNLYLHAKARLAGILIRQAWERSLKTGKPQPPWSWADTHPVARLRIPRLGYDEFVLEGATPRTLAFGPARMQSGACMGEPGNIVLAGHRTSWFRRLEHIEQGDRIELEWFDGHGADQRRIYTVEAIRIAGPKDAALLSSTPQDALTMITCYPFGRSPYSPQRFIVRAAPMDSGRQI
ncbi:MAG: class GN sortase [Acidobacteria bacterium]|nr:class GN sortase [Acidobacteriota bacterium]